MGGPTALAFLQTMPKAWKAEHVAAFVPISPMSVEPTEEILRLADVLESIFLVERVHPRPFLQQRFQLFAIVRKSLDGHKLKMGFDDVVHHSTVSNSAF